MTPSTDPEGIDRTEPTASTWRHYITPEAYDALRRYGYDPEALPCDAVYNPPTATYRSRAAGDVPLRSHVCYLDGVEIDGHRGSDLDPGSTACIHCDYEGPRP